ncbi:MAG: hypothetical protein Q7T29_01960 [Gallionella sp.]|nr:hypothetical protein [Gallionella sp.]
MVGGVIATPIKKPPGLPAAFSFQLLIPFSIQRSNNPQVWLHLTAGSGGCNPPYKTSFDPELEPGISQT